jgi:hypothetical protein
MLRRDKVSYDFRERCGRLDIEGGDCCDMSGCIAFFKAIDPDVQTIDTFSGSERDTGYVKRSWGWQAVCADGRVWPEGPTISTSAARPSATRQP